MSLIGIAVRSNETEPTPPFMASASPTPKEQLASFFAAYVKWIPTEVVVTFGAWVAANWEHQQKLYEDGKDKIPPAPQPSVEPKIWWLCLLLSIVLVPILVWLADQPADKFVRKTLMAGIGFVVWSASISHSFAWSWVKAEDLEWVWYGAAVVLVGGLVAKVGEKVLDLGVMTGWKRIF